MSKFKRKIQKKPTRRRLKSMSDVRRYLACLINDLKNGEIDPAIAGKLGYLLNILRGVVSDSDLEARISALEEENKK